MTAGRRSPERTKRLHSQGKKREQGEIKRAKRLVEGEAAAARTRHSRPARLIAAEAEMQSLGGRLMPPRQTTYSGRQALGGLNTCAPLCTPPPLPPLPPLWPGAVVVTVSWGASWRAAAPY